jgi:hypothetical protein
MDDDDVKDERPPPRPATAGANSHGKTHEPDTAGEKKPPDRSRARSIFGRKKSTA